MLLDVVLGQREASRAGGRGRGVGPGGGRRASPSWEVLAEGDGGYVGVGSRWGEKEAREISFRLDGYNQVRRRDKGPDP